MRLLKTSTQTSLCVFGFTLIEVLVVLGLMLFIAQLCLTKGIDSYDRELSRSDRRLLLGALREARSESVNGTCATASLSTCIDTPVTHGVFLSSKGFTIFEGPTYALRTTSADQNYQFSSKTKPFYTSDNEVVFAANTGNGSSGTSTLSIISMDNRILTIQVNPQGAILNYVTQNTL